MVARFDVCLVNLDPTIGSKIKKIRPCVVISPDEMNRHLATVVIVAPMTTVGRDFSSRVHCQFKNRTGWIVLDQVRTVDRRQLVKSSVDLRNRQHLRRWNDFLACLPRRQPDPTDKAKGPDSIRVRAFSVSTGRSVRYDFAQPGPIRSDSAYSAKSDAL